MSAKQFCVRVAARHKPSDSTWGHRLVESYLQNHRRGQSVPTIRTLLWDDFVKVRPRLGGRVLLGDDFPLERIEVGYSHLVVRQSILRQWDLHQPPAAHMQIDVLFGQLQNLDGLFKHGRFERGKVDASGELIGRIGGYLLTIDPESVVARFQVRHSQRLVVDCRNEIGGVSSYAHGGVLPVDWKGKRRVGLGPGERVSGSQNRMDLRPNRADGCF
jgi:hypothetical protein